MKKNIGHSVDRGKEFIRSLATHSVVRGGAAVLTGSVGANAIAYVYHLVLGRILGPAQYGELASLLSLFYIINVPSSTLQTILTKFFSSLRAKKNNGEIHSLYASSIKWISAFLLAGLVGVGLAVRPLAAYLQIRDPVAVFWLYCIFGSYLFSIVPISILQAFQKFGISSVIVNISSLFRLVLGIAGAFISVSWVLLSNVISNSVAFVLYLMPIRSIVAAKPKPLAIRAGSLARYSIPTLLAMFSSAALFSQDVVLVKHYFLPVPAGIYSSLAVLGKVIYYASYSITYVLFPVLAERRELQKDHKRLVLFGLGTVGMLSFGLTCIYILFPSYVVRMLYGTAFDAAIPLVGIFGIFLSLYSLVIVLMNSLLAIGKTKVWIPMVIGVLMQNVGINIMHHSLSQIIYINILTVGAMLVSLLIYYFYAKDQS